MLVLVGAIIFGWFFFLFTVASVSLLAGIPIGRLQLFIGSVLTLAWTFFVSVELFGRKGCIIGTYLHCICNCLDLLLKFLAHQYIEMGVDVKTYHFTAISALKQGWNPVYTDWFLFAHNKIDPRIEGYTKAPWYISATLYSLWDFEDLKFMNALGGLGAMFLCLGAFLRLAFLRYWQVALLAIASAASPVIANQFLSGYVDGLHAACVIATGAAVVLAITLPSKTTSMLLAGIVALGVNIKLTGLFTIVLAISLLLIVYLMKSESKIAALRVGIVAVIGILLGTFFLGYDPYVLNTFFHGNPFWPMDERFIQIAQEPMPVQWYDKSPATRFLLSAFSEAYLSRDYNLKVPFVITGADAKAFLEIGPRAGGFGPFYGGALLLSVLGLIVAAPKALGNRVALGSGAALFLLIGTVLLSPVSHEARYVVQAPLIPIAAAALIFFIAGFRESGQGDHIATSKGQIACLGIGASILLLMVFNFLYIAKQHFLALRLFSDRVASDLSIIRREPQPILANITEPWVRYFFSKEGITVNNPKKGQALAAGICIAYLPDWKLDVDDEGRTKTWLALDCSRAKQLSSHSGSRKIERRAAELLRGAIFGSRASTSTPSATEGIPSSREQCEPSVSWDGGNHGAAYRSAQDECCFSRGEIFR